MTGPGDRPGTAGFRAARVASSGQDTPGFTRPREKRASEVRVRPRRSGAALDAPTAREGGTQRGTRGGRRMSGLSPVLPATCHAVERRATTCDVCLRTKQARRHPVPADGPVPHLARSLCPWPQPLLRCCNTTRSSQGDPVDGLVLARERGCMGTIAVERRATRCYPRGHRGAP